METDLFAFEGEGFLGDSLEIDTYEVKKGFYEAFLEKIVQEARSVLGNEFLGLLVYGKPAVSLEKMKEKDVDIVIVSTDGAWNEDTKNQLSKIGKQMEENRYGMKVDGLFMPQKVFEAKIKRMASASIEHSMRMKVDDMDDWLTSNYYTKPTISLFPVYEKNDYLRERIQEAVKNPIKGHPGSLSEFRI